MEIGGAFIVACIEVGHRRHTHVAGGAAHGIEDGPGYARGLDAPFAAGGVMVTVTQEMILDAAEDGEDIRPGPAGQAEARPMVIVGGLATHGDHGVYGGGAAEHLAARIGEGAAIEAGLGHGLEHPVGTRIANGEEVADRDVEPDPVIGAAGLQQEDTVFSGSGKAVGDNAAGRACADDDVVIFGLHCAACLSQPTRLKGDSCAIWRRSFRVWRTRRWAPLMNSLGVRPLKCLNSRMKWDWSK